MTVAGGVLELQPAGGTALRVPSGRIASVAEPEPFTVLVTLADGTALELSRGWMRTQLLDGTARRAGRGRRRRVRRGGRCRPVHRDGRRLTRPTSTLRRRADRLGGRPRPSGSRSPSSPGVRPATTSSRLDVAGQGPLTVTRLAGAPTSSPSCSPRGCGGAEPHVGLPRLAAARPRPDGAARRRRAAARRRGRPGPRPRRDPPRAQRHPAAGRDAARPVRRYPASRSRPTWRSASSR